LEADVISDGRVHIRSIDPDGNVYEDGRPIGRQPPCETHDPAPSRVCRRCLRLVSGVVHDRTPNFDAIARRLATDMGRFSDGAVSDLVSALRAPERRREILPTAQHVGPLFRDRLASAAPRAFHTSSRASTFGTRR